MRQRSGLRVVLSIQEDMIPHCRFLESKYKQHKKQSILFRLSLITAHLTTKRKELLNIMKVLVVGGGGREHAIIWKIKQNQTVEKYIALQEMAEYRKLAECVPIKATDIDGMVEFASQIKWIL